VPAQYTLDTALYLFQSETSFVSDPTGDPVGWAANAVRETTAGFRNGATIYARVTVDPQFALDAIYDLSIEQAYLCAGVTGFTPRYDPSNDVYGCIQPSVQLAHRFKILDRSNRISEDASFNGVPFEVVLADDATYSVLDAQNDDDGFTMNTRALYEVFGGFEWYLQVIYRIDGEGRRRRRRDDNTEIGSATTGTNMLRLRLQPALLETTMAPVTADPRQEQVFNLVGGIVSDSSAGNERASEQAAQQLGLEPEDVEMSVAASEAVVRGVTELSGVSVEAFEDDVVRAEFAAALAASLGLREDQIRITDVVQSSGGDGRRRRREGIGGGGVMVAYEIVVDDGRGDEVAAMIVESSENGDLLEALVAVDASLYANAALAMAGVPEVDEQSRQVEVCIENSCTLYECVGQSCAEVSSYERTHVFNDVTSNDETLQTAQSSDGSSSSSGTIVGVIVVIIVIVGISLHQKKSSGSAHLKGRSGRRSHHRTAARDIHMRSMNARRASAARRQKSQNMYITDSETDGECTEV